jgi:translation initiation factor 1
MSTRIVYSTGVGTLCPNCRRAVRECVCPKGAPGAAKVGAVRVGRETKGRAGKGVTTVSGLALPLSEIEALAAQLKKRCGSGGTVRDGVIEVQGDHRDTIVAALIKLGWQAKKSGG